LGRQPLRASFAVEHGDRARHHPAVGAVLAQHAVLAVEGGRAPFEVGGQVGLQGREVLGVHAVEPRARHLLGRGLLPVDERAEARAEVHALAGEVPVEQAVAGALQRERVALFAQAQLSPGLPALLELPREGLELRAQVHAPLPPAGTGRET
jgi:hypothetical protein